jgi:hypothetical protein
MKEAKNKKTKTTIEKKEVVKRTMGLKEGIQI